MGYEQIMSTRNFPLLIQEFVKDIEHPALQLALKLHEIQGTALV